VAKGKENWEGKHTNVRQQIGKGDIKKHLSKKRGRRKIVRKNLGRVRKGSIDLGKNVEKHINWGGGELDRTTSGGKLRSLIKKRNHACRRKKCWEHKLFNSETKFKKPSEGGGK